MSVIGIDTSNYTTSIAYFDGEGGVNCSRLLPVKQGELGLRQPAVLARAADESADLVQVRGRHGDDGNSHMRFSANQRACRDLCAGVPSPCTAGGPPAGAPLRVPLG